jgi:hypothetical protein
MSWSGHRWGFLTFVPCLARPVVTSLRSVPLVIDDMDHEDLKDTLRALNARLVELDDRVPDANQAARDSLTSAWRAYNRLARIIDPTMVARPSAALTTWLGTTANQNEQVRGF